VVTWKYIEDRRLSPAEARSQPKDKRCVMCGGVLLRLAEREATKPYHWIPCGWVCANCNIPYMVMT
jgi:uncharacterized protein with PIN domain